jgi:hypothetical protein
MSNRKLTKLKSKKETTDGKSDKWVLEYASGNLTDIENSIRIKHRGEVEVLSQYPHILRVTFPKRIAKRSPKSFRVDGIVPIATIASKYKSTETPINEGALTAFSGFTACVDEEHFTPESFRKRTKLRQFDLAQHLLSATARQRHLYFYDPNDTLAIEEAIPGVKYTVIGSYGSTRFNDDAYFVVVQRWNFETERAALALMSNQQEMILDNRTVPISNQHLVVIISERELEVAVSKAKVNTFLSRMVIVEVD